MSNDFSEQMNPDDITVTPEAIEARIRDRLGQQLILIENLAAGQEALATAVREARAEVARLKEENAALRESLAGCKGMGGELIEPYIDAANRHIMEK